MNRRSFLGLIAGLPFVTRAAPTYGIDLAQRPDVGAVVRVFTNGDTTPALLDPHERVLNRRQQEQLIDEWHVHHSRELYDALTRQRN